MNKKILLILGSLLIIAGGSTIIYIYLAKNSFQPTPLSTSKKQNSISVTPSPNLKIKEFVDPSGFKFNYPENATVKPKNNTNKNIFSSLQIISVGKKGEITISVESSNLKDLEAWLKTQKKLQETKKIKLADLDAIQFKKDEMIQIAAIDTGALFTITVDIGDSEQLWSKTADTIIKSFAFVLPQNQNTAPAQSAGNEDDVILEGEEIVE